jgi:hypothetical protein
MVPVKVSRTVLATASWKDLETASRRDPVSVSVKASLMVLEKGSSMVPVTD